MGASAGMSLNAATSSSTDVTVTRHSARALTFSVLSGPKSAGCVTTSRSRGHALAHRLKVCLSIHASGHRLGRSFYLNPHIVCQSAQLL